MSDSDDDLLIGTCIEQARKAGAEAVVSLSRGKSWSARASTGAVDAVEASEQQGLGLWVVFPDGRQASVSSTDLSMPTIARLAAEVVSLAEAGEADEYQGLAPIEACGLAEVSGLDDEADGFSEADALEHLLAGHELMSQADSRISNSHRCSTRASRTQRRRTTSRGEDQRISTTDYHLGQVAVAEADGEKQMGYDMTRARNWRDLRPVSAVADAAVKRACQGFGWKQAESAKVRCLFDPDMATSLLGTWLALLDGRAVYRGQSRFADAIDTKIAAEAFHLEDDPLIPKAVGSRPCDGEGVKSAPLTPVENGVLKHFFCDSYAARRLGRSVTGHSSGSSNCRLRPGDYSPEALLKELGTGFFVTGLQGHGFNTASGEWSRGASGFWVENGEITNPVQNVTLATNLAECYERLLAVGNDPLEESSTSSPSVLIDGIQLGGS